MPIEIAYHPRRPEQTPLYLTVQRHWLTFVARAEAFDHGVPGFVHKEMESFLRCGILAHGFCRVRCPHCNKDRLVAWSCRGRGFCPSCTGRRMAEVEAHLCDEVVGDTPLRQWVLTVPKPLRYLMAYNAKATSAVLNVFITTVHRWLQHRAKQHLRLTSVRMAYPGSITAIQRYDSAAGLNVHFHALVTDGVFVHDPTNTLRFQVLDAPSNGEVAALAWDICNKTIDHLRQNGMWVDVEDVLAQAEPLLSVCASAAIDGRILFGSAKTSGRLRLLPASEPSSRALQPGHGFNLHATTCAKAGDSLARKRLSRYIVRPPIANSRLALLADGRVRLQLKRPYSDGTTHLFFDPLDFIARLVALVPPPRMHQLRFHGIYAPHHKLRTVAVPGVRTPNLSVPASTPLPGSDQERRNISRRKSWARLLHSTFGFDVLRCPRCNQQMLVLAAIIDGAEVRRILQHLQLPIDPPRFHPARAARAPPEIGAA